MFFFSHLAFRTRRAIQLCRPDYNLFICCEDLKLTKFQLAPAYLMLLIVLKKWQKKKNIGNRRHDYKKYIKTRLLFVSARGRKR